MSLAGFVGAIARPPRGEDVALLARFVAERDEAAFAALVRSHAGMVLATCRRMLGHHHDAEDATQAVFVVLAGHAGKVRRADHLAAWLHGVAVRVCRKAVAMRRKRPTPTDVPPELGMTTDATETVFDQALEAVPADLRVPLVLCHLRGLSREAAAAELGLSETTLRGRLDRGKERLRQELIRRGVPVSAAVVTALTPAVVSAADVATIVRRAVGAETVPAAVASLTHGVLPTMSLVHRLAIGLGVLTVLAVIGGVTVLLLPKPAQADPFREWSKPDPKAGKADAKLDGVWVATQQTPDGKTRRDYRLKFLDGQRLLLELTAKFDFSAVPQVITLKMRYELNKDGELKQDVLEKFVGEDKVNLSDNDKRQRVWKLKWADGGKGFTAKPQPESDSPWGTLNFARDDQPAAKAEADPLVPEALTKLDRTIAKLPKFDTEKPGYLLLAFGPAAREKVWVVFDGANLYVDKNGNGDLTEDGETVAADPGFSRPPKSYVFRVTGVGVEQYTLDVSTLTVGPETVAPMIAVGRKGKLLQKVGPTDIRFKPTPEEARVVHFGSTVLVARPSLTLQGPLNAAKADDWRVQVGTPGVGAGSFASFGNDDLPKDVNPVAEFVFRPKTPGGKPITRTVPLDERCCGDQFFARVEVPKEAADGPAKVTLSFPNCPFGTVLTQTYDVPVVREK